MSQGVVSEGMQHHLHCRKNNNSILCEARSFIRLFEASILRVSAAKTALTISQIGDLPSALTASMRSRLRHDEYGCFCTPIRGQQ